MQAHDKDRRRCCLLPAGNKSSGAVIRKRVSLAQECGQKRYSLERLAQPHVISKYAPNVLGILPKEELDACRVEFVSYQALKSGLQLNQALKSPQNDTGSEASEGCRVPCTLALEKQGG